MSAHTNKLELIQKIKTFKEILNLKNINYDNYFKFIDICLNESNENIMVMYQYKYFDITFVLSLDDWLVELNINNGLISKNIDKQNLIKHKNFVCENIKIGDIYCHYKNTFTFYKIIDIAFSGVNDTVSIIYQDLIFYLNLKHELI